MNQPVFVAHAHGDDLKALVALEKRCFSHPWSEPAFSSAIDDASTLVLVLRTPSPSIAGYAVLQLVADELHIHNLAVAPELRRCGLGRRFLGVALAVAAGRGARAAHLEVRASNQAALRLYQAAGFKSAGRRGDYYALPQEDALLLSKEGLDRDSTGAKRDPEA